VSLERYIIGRVAVERPSYSTIFAPIQGTVAFDIDGDENLYLLKKTRPYLYLPNDTENTYDESGHAAEPWYVKMSTTALWDQWFETTSDHSGVETNVIPVANFRQDQFWEPEFNLGSVFGDRGSIHIKDRYLLISIAGEKDDLGIPNGVLLFKKRESGDTTSSYLYGGPDEFSSFMNADVVPMASRIDLSSYDEDTDIASKIYIALSDLKRSTATASKSKIIKVNIITRQNEWEWGTKADKDDGVSSTFALLINDVNSLSYNDTEIIVST